MFERMIWDKLLECIFKFFENFEISRVKRGKQIFKNHEGDLSKQLPEPNMWLLINF